MTALYLIPIVVTVATAFSRVLAIRPARVEGKPLGEITLSVTERIRYHRVSLYGLAILLVLGAVSGAIHLGIELVALLAMLGALSRPVRYRFTSAGVALNGVVFRRWSEFSAYREVRWGLRLTGKPGFNRFDVRISQESRTRAVQLLSGVLRPAAPVVASKPPRGGGRSKRPMLLIPVLVLVGVLALGAGVQSAFADDGDAPTVDAAGTTVGAPEDLAGIGVGGGSLAVLDSDGAVDVEATAKMFATAQSEEPFAYNLAAYVNQNRLAVNFVWVLVAGYLVMFMQAGFAMVETGFCRAKSAMQVMMTNFMIYGVGMMAYWVLGFAIQFGGVGLTGPTNLGAGLLALDKEFTISLAGTDWGLFGYKGFFLGPDVLDVGIAVLFLFQMVFMDTAATILTGAVAERWRWVSLLIWGVFIGGVIYPLFGNWAWGGGWLFQLKDSAIERPYVDFAGSGVVHAVGGWAALAAAWVLGPRLGKYNADGSANAMPGHNINMAVIGTFILAFGWFGFNPGSTLGASGSGNLRIGEVAVVTMLAGAAGSITSMLYARFTLASNDAMLMTAVSGPEAAAVPSIKLGKYDPGYMINGLLAGLVAITAPSGYVSPISAVIIGGIAGVLVCVAMAFIDQVLHIDDPVGAVAVHAVNGVWGVLAVGLFADGTAPDYLVIGHPVKGLFFGDGRQLLAQAVGAAVVIVWAFGTSFVLFSVLKMLGIYRSKPEDELAGLDLPEMGTHAYPPQDMPGYANPVFTGEFTLAPQPTPGG